MARALLKSSPAPAPVRYATQVLNDYEHWLQANFKTTSSYLPHARSFLIHYKTGGSLLTQIDTVSRHKSPTAKSLLKRFQLFLIEKGIDQLHNDLLEERLPKASILVKLFLLSSKDRLKSKTSRQTYANILNGYLRYAGDIRHIEKFTAERFIFSKQRSDFTTRLYVSVVRNFVEWILSYLDAPDDELSPLELGIKHSFSRNQIHSLKQILSIRSKTPDTTTYHKDSLNKSERERLLKAGKSSYERTVIALMAWNGLRPIEVIRLATKDINLSKGMISVWGKGRSKKSRQIIPAFKVVRRELRVYLKERGAKPGRLFAKLNYKSLHELVMMRLNQIRVTKNRGPFSPHSLRHTAGQLLYDQGIPLEFIQKTLRHTSLESTLVYAQKAIDQAYLRRMKRL